MLVVVWSFILMMKMMMMMMMMMNDAASAETITADTGEEVLLTSGLQGYQPGHDIRWTHPHLVMSLKKNVTCHSGRYQLTEDYSLKFIRVQPEDSGNYSLEVFDENGKLLRKRDFLLRVKAETSSSLVVRVWVYCFLLLLLPFIIVIIIVKRRWSQRTRTAGPLEENLYMPMHSCHNNKRKEEVQDSHYVPCHPVSMETPIPEQMSADVENIYV